MLREIQQLLAERGQMTLAELAIHFRVDRSAMDGMLQVLVRKGVVELETAVPSKCCKGCVDTDCDRLPVVVRLVGG